MDVKLFDELARCLPRAEKDKDNFELKEFLAGVALIGEYIANADLEKKCEAGFSSVEILKKYNVKADYYFDHVNDFCKQD
jgi:hypothetical protein